jgi:hypothetical protein
MYGKYHALLLIKKKCAGFYQPDSNKKKGFETTGRSRNEKQGVEMIRQELKRKGKNRNEKEEVEICRKK